jgi:hypothetical protein
MQAESQLQSIDYAKAIAVLVAQLPLERAAQVYDFVRFLQSESTSPAPTVLVEEDWLNDPEEQLQIEDALWAAAQARHPAKFSALAAEARAEIDAGTTQPMFTAEGELTLS